MADQNEKLCEALRELAGEMRQLRNEIRSGRERQTSVRRVKSLQRVVRLQDVPVDDIAAAAAKRALAKLRG